MRIQITAILITAALILSACSGSGTEITGGGWLARNGGGTETVGGGDHISYRKVFKENDIRDVFKKAISTALEIVTFVDSNKLEASPNVTAIYTEKNRLGLITELKELNIDSDLLIYSLEKLYVGKEISAYTGFKSMSPIHINLPMLLEIGITLPEATMLLIHECGHHLGILDHNLLDKLAEALWNKGSKGDSPDRVLFLIKKLTSLDALNNIETAKYIEELGALRAEGSLPYISNILNYSQSEEIRSSAVKAISKFSTFEVVDILHNIIANDPSLNVRATAYEAYGIIARNTADNSGAKIIALYQTALADSNIKMVERMGIIRGIGYINDPLVFDMLKQELEKVLKTTNILKNDQLIDLICAIFESMGKTKNDKVRESMLIVFIKTYGQSITPRGAFSFLKSTLKDSRPMLRLYLSYIKALVYAGDEKALDDLIKSKTGISNIEPLIEALPNLDNKFAADYILDLFLGNNEVRKQNKQKLIIALLKLGRFTIEPLTKALIDNDDPAVRADVALVLGRMKNSYALEALEKAMLNDKDDSVVVSAKIAIDMIRGESTE